MLQINSGSWKITIINTMSLAGSWTNARKRKQYSLNVNYHRKNIADKMRAIRTKLKDADVLDEFDRVVFESLVEEVIVGEQAEDGIVDPYKLTFVLKRTDERCIPDARDR